MMSRQVSASIAVVLLLCTAASSSRCPLECICGPMDRSPDRMKADCSNDSLTTFPQHFSHHLTEINLSFNKFVELGSDFSIHGTQNIRIVNLSNNSINKISENAFSSLNLLWILDLSGNKLESLPRNLFQSNHALWNLILRGNSIKLPHHATFLNAPNLRKLDLSYNNLDTIDELSFINMNKLTYLLLNNNRLNSLSQSWFNGLVHMKQLYLEDNNLQFVHPDTFVDMTTLIELSLSRNILMIKPGKPFLRIPSLELLYLKSCNLTHLPDDMFVMMTRLRYVLLTGNNLRALDHGILNYLHDLVYLNVCDNLLECNCDLKDAWQWCKYNSVEADVSCSLDGSRQKNCAGNWDVVGELVCNATHDNSAQAQYTAEEQGQDSSNHIGLFVGLGIVFLVVIVAAVIFVYWRRKTARPSRHLDNSTNPTSFADILPLHNEHEDH